VWRPGGAGSNTSGRSGCGCCRGKLLAALLLLLQLVLLLCQQLCLAGHLLLQVLHQLLLLQEQHMEVQTAGQEA
jgi:hypothetical protein